MSSQAPVVAPRRRAERQADMVVRLADAAVEELRETGYDGLTVRNVARRAGVAPATAYTWFASKDHLVTEAFWRGLQALEPPKLDGRWSPARRVEVALSGVTALIAGEPALSAAATVSVLAPDPDVAALRLRIGAFFHRLFQTALGADGDPEVVAALDMAFSGGLLQSGMGLMPYGDLSARMATVVELLTGGRS
jgi:AcrR family transcriptional regulator